MKKTCLAVLLSAAASTACGDSENSNTMPDASTPMPDAPMTTCTVTPGAWSAPNFATNAATALALRAQIEALSGNTSPMRLAETTMPTAGDEVAELEAVYNAGTPVLSANVHTAFDPVMDDVFAEFAAAITAGDQDLVTTAWDPGAAGGIWVTGTGPTRRAFNTGALELRQIVHKGLFAGGVLYPYAVKLTEGTIDEATIDSIAAAWGSNATLDSTQGVRTHSANYSFGMGFHAEIGQALTAAKAYAADSKCNTERDTALRTVFRAWEQSMVARNFFYANDADTKLATAAGNDDIVSAGLHNFAEGVGLTLGFYGLPNPTSGPLANAGRTITDADIDAIMTALRVNRTDLGASTVGTFVTDTAALNAAVTTVGNRLKTVYQLTDADIAKYKAPTGG